MDCYLYGLQLNSKTYVIPAEEVQVHVDNHAEQKSADDKTDAKISEMMCPTDEDDSYVRVAGGKILNRSNCTLRKKLNSSKIDPVLVISSEPEYVTNNVYVDDKTMKENLLNNLINDIERKGNYFFLQLFKIFSKNPRHLSK